MLVPNGKLVINAPLMPLPKAIISTHHERSILDGIPGMHNIYLWNHTNPTKSLMFGSYPYPSKFYAQNTVEFIGLIVKQGRTLRPDPDRKDQSSLSEEKWREYTSQVWDIPIPNRADLAYGEHPAIMPEEIARRIRLFTCVGDTVLDPFAGSGTTLKVASQLKRNYLGYEIYDHYSKLIDRKVEQTTASNQQLKLPIITGTENPTP